MRSIMVKGDISPDTLRRPGAMAHNFLFLINI